MVLWVKSFRILYYMFKRSSMKYLQKCKHFTMLIIYTFKCHIKTYIMHASDNQYYNQVGTHVYIG